MKPRAKAAAVAKRRTAATGLAEPLQQIDRTWVLQRGRRLAYFAGCDYFRLASHPAVLCTLHEAVDEFGLNVAASRKTTGHHALYTRLEEDLAEFFGVEGALLISNGYMTSLAVAQALAGEFTHALIDERAHGCLQDAARILGCPVRHFRHRDVPSAVHAAQQCGPLAKLLILTDGLYSHSGEVAPLDQYLRQLPRSARFLLDDAHGAGTIGETGRGTLEFLGVPDRRIIRTITLSKAFGVYGGAILGSRSLVDKIIARSQIFVGNTPLPLPLAAAARTALKLLRTNSRFRHRLINNTRRIKAALAEAGLPGHDGPGPIVAILPRDSSEAGRLSQSLLAAGIHPPLIRYPGGPAEGYFRFVISSEHTEQQLAGLGKVLSGHRRSPTRHGTKAR